MKKFIYYFLFSILAACHSVQEKDVKHTTSQMPCPEVNMDSLRQAIKTQLGYSKLAPIITDRQLLAHSYMAKHLYKTDYTFSESTKVYAEADTNSTVLASMPFNTRIVAPENERYTHQEIEWLKIKVSGKIEKGFIKVADLAGYQTGVNDDGFLVGALPELKGRDKIAIRRYKEKEHIIVETYVTSHLSSAYTFEARIFSALKGLGNKGDRSNALFIYDTYRTSCPGGGHTEFILDDGKKLRLIISAETEGEGGEGSGGYNDSESIYLPLRFDNGKIMLVKNGDYVNIFNSQTTELNIFPHPEKYDIPLEKMVVYQHEEETYGSEEEDVYYSENGEDKKLERPKASYTCKTIVYEWDGTKLIKKKEFVSGKK